jgi:hypothetical protein
MSGGPLLLSRMITAAVSIRKANRRGTKSVALPPHPNVVRLNFSNVLLLNFPLFHLA